MYKYINKALHNTLQVSGIELAAEFAPSPSFLSHHTNNPPQGFKKFEK